MKKIRISALLFGIIAGALGALVQIYWSVQPPQAYGICMVCHAKDLINTIFNNFPWYHGTVAAVGKKGFMLTTIAVPAGAFFAALISGEFKLRFSENGFFAFFLGFGVMTCGLAISGCPMRLLLRLGYGDFSALIMVALVVLGILCGTLILKRRAKRI